MTTAPKFPIDLKPTPGFCVKSSTVTPATLPPPARTDNSLILEPTAPTIVPAGRKVFINICYDKNVPPPPAADEDVVKRAMDTHKPNEDAYYVPVVVSQPRQDNDKAGSPALVFDCVYNSTLKSRTLRDAEFKIFLVELSLQRIEGQTSLVLSRQIGTPNIVAKGRLEPRRVWVPAWLAIGKPEGSEEDGKSGDQAEKWKGKKLIEEIDVSEDKRRGNEDGSASNILPKLKGILKHGGPKASSAVAAGAGSAPAAISKEVSVKNVPMKSRRPLWSWEKGVDERLNIMIDVPKETPYEVIANSTLDIEPRRLILHIPVSTKTPSLDLDLDLSKSDAEIAASAPGSVTAAGFHGSGEDDQGKEAAGMLLLKRQRDFDVDAASAEWRVAEGKLVVRT